MKVVKIDESQLVIESSSRYFIAAAILCICSVAFYVVSTERGVPPPAIVVAVVVTGIFGYVTFSDLLVKRKIEFQRGNRLITITKTSLIVQLSKTQEIPFDDFVRSELDERHEPKRNVTSRVVLVTNKDRTVPLTEYFGSDNKAQIIVNQINDFMAS